MRYPGGQEEWHTWGDGHRSHCTAGAGRFSAEDLSRQKGLPVTGMSAPRVAPDLFQQMN